MDVIRLGKGQAIAKQKGIVKEWYLIQQGTVIQKMAFASVTLGQNAIIGILESDWFICDYIAGTDVTLAVIPCKNAADLKQILSAYPNYRGVFLRTAVEQRHQMFGLYVELQTRTRQFHAFAQTLYNDYQALCAKNGLEGQPFSRMEYFQRLEMEHRVEDWEVNNSNSLVKNYLKDYLLFMQRDDSLCVGAIMEASLQMRRIMQGVEEMVNYLLYNKDILLSESGDDLFQLCFELAVRMAKRGLDVEPVKKEISFLTGFIGKLRLYDAALVSQRVGRYEAYDFTGGSEDGVETAKDIDITAEDCLGHILLFAGYAKEERDEIRARVEAYRSLPDMLSTDSKAYQIRRQLSPMFYEIYERAFFRAVEHEDDVPPIVAMFLNFGFMDVQLAGEEHAKELYDLTKHLNVFHSEHVYTIYEWLKNIYNAEKDPSKNEFDLDYPAYLLEQRKNGDLTAEQVKMMHSDRKERVHFEIKNMFQSANRITYGKITTFCPILGEYDLINSLDKMAVTAKRLEEAVNSLRRVDYSVFYREVGYSGPANDLLTHEPMMQEALPDIILMPNAGTRAMMWQETADKRRDTPGRFLFPVFTAVDLEDMMVETVGRFRWEMCRKIQGVRWNDIREKSLTAEYCDYIQFYRKNHDLSADAKEKLKNALARAKNSYREVFVLDYENWVKYESKGSFRLNKVARDILVKYCPFAGAIRQDLKANPMYQNTIPKFELDNAKKQQRLTALYEKVRKSGGAITPQMEENLSFYEL